MKDKFRIGFWNYVDTGVLEEEAAADDWKALGMNMPMSFEFDPEKLEGKVIALPAREDIDSQIAEHMIVELYSK